MRKLTAILAMIGSTMASAEPCETVTTGNCWGFTVTQIDIGDSQANPKLSAHEVKTAHYSFIGTNADRCNAANADFNMGGPAVYSASNDLFWVHYSKATPCRQYK